MMDPLHYGCVHGEEQGGEFLTRTEQYAEHVLAS